MAQLTRIQLEFLSEHEIPLSVMFDADGIPKSVYKELMKAAGMQFAYGVSKCRRGHDTIRSRAGHCIQCSHAAIDFMKRNDGRRDIFVAGSIHRSLIKLGNSSDVPARIASMNAEQYGDACDWRLLHVLQSVPSAGAVESRIAVEIAEYRLGGVYYFKGRHRQQCYDLFTCSFETALIAVDRNSPEGCSRQNAADDLTSMYAFPNRPTSGITRVGNSTN